MFVRLSLCDGMHCDHMVHVSADLSLWLDSPMFWATWKRGGVWLCKLGVISQEQLKIRD